MDTTQQLRVITCMCSRCDWAHVLSIHVVKKSPFWFWHRGNGQLSVCFSKETQSINQPSTYSQPFGIVVYSEMRSRHGAYSILYLLVCCWTSAWKKRQKEATAKPSSSIMFLTSPATWLVPWTNKQWDVDEQEDERPPPTWWTRRWATAADML